MLQTRKPRCVCESMAVGAIPAAEASNPFVFRHEVNPKINFCRHCAVVCLCRLHSSGWNVKQTDTGQRRSLEYAALGRASLGFTLVRGSHGHPKWRRWPQAVSWGLCWSRVRCLAIAGELELHSRSLAARADSDLVKVCREGVAVARGNRTNSGIDHL
jgi:hypothetical protein